MTKQQLKQETQRRLKDSKDYRQRNAEIWIENGVNLEEVDYKEASSQAHLTNAHRNNTSIKNYEWFLEELDKLEWKKS